MPVVSRVALRAVVAFALVGCQAELSAGLDEAQADAVVVALDGAGIGAEREREEPARDPAHYRVMVPRADLPAALAVLHEQGLPREREPGWESLFDGAGLVPSAHEEQARQAAALGGELGRSIEAMDGVERARVHVALPDPTHRPLDADAAPVRASVLVAHRPGARVDEAAVRSLVAGAVQGLAPEDVAVVLSETSAPPSRPPNLVWVGPVAVSRGTAGVLKALLGGSLALHLILAVALVLSRRRATRRRGVSTSDPVVE